MRNEAFGNVGQSSQNIRRGNPQNIQPERRQLRIAPSVEVGLITHVVRYPVKFDGRPGGVTIKIHHKFVDRMLIAKFQP